MRLAALTIITTTVGYGLLFCLEQLAPLRAPRRAIFARLLLNLSISAMVFVVAGGFVRPVALKALRWSSDKQLGLLQIAQVSPIVELALTFLLMDLTFYWWHVANHRIPFLWRFHNVHHADPDLDVSTGFRFHVGEVGMSALFRVAQVMLLGPSLAGFAAYEMAFQANTLFHHSNVRLPIRIERLLNKVLVTPRMHGIHHSQIQAETNSNYGVLFTWWDRVHRTLGLNIPQEKIVIGVPGYSRPEDNHFINALWMPFRKQRDYWRVPEGVRRTRARTEQKGHASQLAE